MKLKMFVLPYQITWNSRIHLIYPNTCQHNLHIPLTLLSLITHNIWISAYCSSKGISNYFCSQHLSLREAILSSQGPFSGIHIFA